MDQYIKDIEILILNRKCVSATVCLLIPFVLGFCYSTNNLHAHTSVFTGKIAIWLGQLFRGCI